jgi:hypothetical protein
MKDIVTGTEKNELVITRVFDGPTREAWAEYGQAPPAI